MTTLPISTTERKGGQVFRRVGFDPHKAARDFAGDGKSPIACRSLLLFQKGKWAAGRLSAQALKWFVPQDKWLAANPYLMSSQVNSVILAHVSGNTTTVRSKVKTRA